MHKLTQIVCISVGLIFWVALVYDVHSSSKVIIYVSELEACRLCRHPSQRIRHISVVRVVTDRIFTVIHNRFSQLSWFNYNFIDGKYWRSLLCQFKEARVMWQRPQKPQTKTRVIIKYTKDIFLWTRLIQS